MKHYFFPAIFLAAGALLATSCCDEKIIDEKPADKPDWYYSGGQLDTSYLFTTNAFEQPSEAVENQGMYQQFKNGEALFEKPFMAN